MEKRKAPVHDFAPSWLKINSYDKDLNNTNKKLDTKRSASSGLVGGEDNFDLRPQYLKQRDIKDSITSSSQTNQQKPVNQSQVNTLFDTDSDKISEEASRLNKGWSSSITNSNNSNSWSTNRRFNPKGKPTSNSVSSSVTADDSLSSTRRVSSNSRSNDIGVANINGTGREDLTKSNIGYPHHHQNHPHNFHHHGNNKVRLSNSARDESPPVSGDVVGETIKGKSNTKNGFVDSNNFQEEFPSLVDEKQVVENNNGSNVWDNVANKVFRSGVGKVSLVSRHLHGSSLFDEKSSLVLNGEKSMNGGSLFRALVPVVPRRKNVNCINGNSSGSKESTTLVNSLSNLSLGSTGKIMPVFAKPSNHSSAGHSMAILVKKHPKMRSNNNLQNQSVRSSSSDSRPDPNDEQRSNDPFDEDDDRTTNSSGLDESSIEEAGKKIKDEHLQGDGLNDRAENAEVHLLSSSLEAEERLLREMGWSEEDGDNGFYAPLTDAEVKEFKDLIRARSSSKRHISPKINRGQFKFQINSNQLPLSQLNFLNSLATGNQDNDSDSTSEDESDDDDGDER
ncbi:vasculin [Tetranychus urticae]|uniref:Vasculin n=1 Tax=Tetranychus urticae TaxID=32264 RepID=T1KNM8_TETUR|nr:vasculin [Tetranychus urticae]